VRVGRVGGQQRGAVGRGDREAVAVLAQRVAGGLDRVEDPGRLGAREHAELVAAHPVGGPAGGHRGLQACGEAGQQRVAGGVAEGVVVGLEAVEVEDRQHDRAGAVELGRLALQLLHQGAAVADAGERVGLGVAAGGVALLGERHALVAHARHDDAADHPEHQREQGLEPRVGELSGRPRAVQERCRHGREVGEHVDGETPRRVGHGDVQHVHQE
jgi:hypothetical protein